MLWQCVTLSCVSVSRLLACTTSLDERALARHTDKACLVEVAHVVREHHEPECILSYQNSQAKARSTTLSLTSSVVRPSKPRPVARVCPTTPRWYHAPREPIYVVTRLCCLPLYQPSSPCAETHDFHGTVHLSVPHHLRSTSTLKTFAFNYALFVFV
jgi:hypothetical protein